MISRLTHGFSDRCLRFASTVADARARTRFRLAGCASTGRGLNPLGHDERFPATSFPISRAYPDASWSHVRRRFYEIAQGGNAPIAEGALQRIAALYRLESTIRGQAPERRRTLRDQQSRPLVDQLRAWLDAQLAKVPGRSRMAEATRYALSAATPPGRAFGSRSSTCSRPRNAALVCSSARSAWPARRPSSALPT